MLTHPHSSFHSPSPQWMMLAALTPAAPPENQLKPNVTHVQHCCCRQDLPGNTSVKPQLRYGGRCHTSWGPRKLRMIVIDLFMFSWFRWLAPLGSSSWSLLGAETVRALFSKLSNNPYPCLLLYLLYLLPVIDVSNPVAYYSTAVLSNKLKTVCCKDVAISFVRWEETGTWDTLVSSSRLFSLEQSMGWVEGSKHHQRPVQVQMGMQCWLQRRVTEASTSSCPRRTKRRG